MGIYNLRYCNISGYHYNRYMVYNQLVNLEYPCTVLYEMAKVIWNFFTFYKVPQKVF